MVVSEPLRVAEVAEVYDIDASIHGGGDRPVGRCAWRSPAAGRADLDKRITLKKAASHPRSAEEGARSTASQGPKAKQFTKR
jgi:hypothetical protein